MARVAVVFLVIGLAREPRPLGAQEDRPLEWTAALNAKILCSGVFVQGRKPERHLREDLARFSHFGWRSDFEYRVDRGAGSVTVTPPDTRPRTARYNGDQGCTILPWSATGVFYQPLEVESGAPDPTSTPWPTGDVLSPEPLPAGTDRGGLEAALDFAFDDTRREISQNTRALGS
jgi:hypothetical protein